MSLRPWYQELFGEDYLRAWAPTLTAERSEAEVEGVVRLLQLPAGSRILDLCCGHGRIAVPLAQRGYRVTGQDLSALFLERGRGAAEAAGVEVEWVHSDMRRIPFEATFDAVVNVFTAFGYLESDEEDLEVLRQVRQSLKPGGRFLLDFINREGTIRRWRPGNITRLEDGTLALEEVTFDLLAGRTNSRMTLIDPDGSRREYSFSVRLYTLVELAKLFDAAGLEIEATYGGLDGSELTLDSRRLVVLSRRVD